MIRINYYDETDLDKRDKVRRYHDLIVAHRDSKRLDSLSNWCMKYLGNSYDCFEKVVTASPDEIVQIVQHLNAMGSALDTANNELKYVTANGNKRCYVVDTLYKDMNKDAKDLLLDELDIRVCPYCNRNYVYTADKVNTCELDHFFAKEKYPILAVSFFNLIPSCASCNRKKSNSQFVIYPHKPQYETDDLIEFSTHLKNVAYLYDPKQIQISVKSKQTVYDQQLETLGIEQLYKEHRDIAFEVIRKKQIFSDTYLDNLSKQFSSLRLSRDQMKEVIFGMPEDPQRYVDKPLSKFMRDIYKDTDVE